VILWELLTGQQLFQGTLGEVFGRILFAEPPPPSELRPGLDAALDAICQKALAKEPEQRYPSMEAFGASIGEDRAAGAALPPPERMPREAQEILHRLESVGEQARQLLPACQQDWPALAANLIPLIERSDSFRKKLENVCSAAAPENRTGAARD